MNLYKSVVDDVTSNIREAFLDEGVDEQILQELKSVIQQQLNNIIEFSLLFKLHIYMLISVTTLS